MHRNPALLFVMSFLGATVAAVPSPAQGPAQPRVELLLAGAPFNQPQLPNAGETWFGLYRNPAGGFELRSTTVRVQQTPNGCSNTRIATGDSLVPMFLVSGAPGLRPGPVDTAFTGHRFLYPGEDFSRRLGSSDWYALRAIGTASEAPASTAFSAYELRLSTSRDRFATVQTVVRLDFTLDNTPNIIWAGDLDRDGRLDLYLQLPGGGYSRRYALFLSSLAHSPALVVEAASFHVAD